MSRDTYACERCPLIIELGGYNTWDDAGNLELRFVQVVCRSCGTMHRLLGKNDSHQVFALRGPVRAARPVTSRNVWGDTFETHEWDSESEWLHIGLFSGGFAGINEHSCSCCGKPGQMMSLAELLHPNGYVKNPSNQAKCPVCRDEMKWMATKSW